MLFEMNRGKQVVKINIWQKKKKKKKKQIGGAIPFGLIASLAAPILGEVAKPIFKTILGRGKRKKRWSSR